LRSRIVITISPSPIASWPLVPCFKTLKENNTRKGFLEPAQYDKLARGCAKFGLWMRTAFELAYTYGRRHGELLGLRVGPVSIADRTIRLNRGETKDDDGGK
jgi:integrase